MTGRLNPRRYDLGELRDVTRDPPDRAEDAVEGGESSPEDGTSVPVEPTTDVRPEGRREGAPRTDDRARRANGRGAAEPATGPDGPGRNGDGTDDVESYLRSRHRRREERGADADTRRDAGARRQRSPDDRQRSRGDVPTRAAPGGSPDAAAFLAELSGPQLSKPYLDRLPDAYSAQLEVFEWLETMLESGGKEATLSALEYYESIGWLSERSREELEDIAAGLPAETAAGASLCIADHRESLLYVARLAHRRH